jgi:pimeloyl-ACP methyl ester carboxylesterase
MQAKRFTASGHTTAWLEEGPADGPLLLFVHGWPELSLSWRHQLAAFGALGFRAVAPDLRGYGDSTVYPRHEDYAQERVAGDLIALLDHLGRERAVWIGHDWGAPTVWTIARDWPQRCHAVANLCVPYHTLERGLDGCLGLVNRTIYPEATFPAGQWEYMRYYEHHFSDATATFDADPERVVRLLFRRGNPDGFGQPAATAFTRIRGGWFPEGIPDLPRDAAVVTADELSHYAVALRRNTFFGPDSYYMNHAANAAFAARSPNERLEMPVLFIAALYDYTCDCITSSLAEPMRARCGDLTETVIASGHWMAQERPREVNAVLARWLATRVPQVWPVTEPDIPAFPPA